MSQYVWKAIHVLGKTFDPTDENAKESFICIFKCLSDLLPQEEYRKSLSNFLIQSPVENYVDSQEHAFEWTYKLHTYVNMLRKKKGEEVYNIAIEQAYKNTSVAKTDWAHSIWFLIHYISANLPQNIHPQLATSFKAFIVCLRYILPCKVCRFHMSKYIENVEIDPYLKTNNMTFYWTWMFHNDVNERLGKEKLKYEYAFSLYKIREMYTLIDY